MERTPGLFRVDGTVAVVTSDGTGMGLTMAHSLVGAGASRVYILGRRKQLLDAKSAKEPKLFPVPCDVTSQESLQSAVDQISKESGHINLLIAKAGIPGERGSAVAPGPNVSIQGLRKKVFVDTSLPRFTETLNADVTGLWYTLVAFLELLHAGNETSIATTGRFGTNEEPEGTILYLASRAGAYCNGMMLLVDGGTMCIRPSSY